MATATRRRQKINRFDVQNNNFAPTSRCRSVRFFDFFALVAQLQPESPYLHFLWRT